MTTYLFAYRQRNIFLNTISFPKLHFPYDTQHTYLHFLDLSTL